MKRMKAIWIILLLIALCGAAAAENDLVTVTFTAYYATGSMDPVRVPRGESYVLPESGFTIGTEAVRK